MSGRWLVDLFAELFPSAHSTCLLAWTTGRAQLRRAFLGPVCFDCAAAAVESPWLGGVGPRERSVGTVPAPHACPDPGSCRTCLGDAAARRRAGDV